MTSNASTGALVKLHGTGNFCKVINGKASVVNSIKVGQALSAYHERKIFGELEIVPVEECSK